MTTNVPHLLSARHWWLAIAAVIAVPVCVGVTFGGFAAQGLVEQLPLVALAMYCGYRLDDGPAKHATSRPWAFGLAVFCLTAINSVLGVMSNAAGSNSQIPEPIGSTLMFMVLFIIAGVSWAGFAVLGWFTRRYPALPVFPAMAAVPVHSPGSRTVTPQRIMRVACGVIVIEVIVLAIGWWPRYWNHSECVLVEARSLPSTKLVSVARNYCAQRYPENSKAETLPWEQEW